jgi:hypothetical protein
MSVDMVVQADSAGGLSQQISGKSAGEGWAGQLELYATVVLLSMDLQAQIRREQSRTWSWPTPPAMSTKDFDLFLQPFVLNMAGSQSGRVHQLGSESFFCGWVVCAAAVCGGLGCVALL